MWEQYKKTAKLIQPVIVIVCVAIYFMTGRQMLVAATFFVVMELGAVVGAAWGARLKRRTMPREEELPLARRRGL